MSSSKIERLESAIAANNAGLDVTVHEVIDSTNNWSLRECSNGRLMPFACFAEEQISGKGRRGKQWLMSPHSNIAMSLTWSFDLSQQSLNLLPLSVAMAIAQMLENLALKDVQIKWPNDVYVRGVKIAGVLIEAQAIKDGKQMGTAVVIGIGLNYDMSNIKLESAAETNANLPEFTDCLSEFRQQKLEQKVEREELAAQLLQTVINACHNYQIDSHFCLNDFRQRYDFCQHKVVEIMQENQRVLTGTAQGITEQGELIVMIDGEKRLFNSADVSVKADKK